jgi:hypothetical protein
MIRSAPEASRQALANAKGLLGLVMAAVLTGLFATGYHTALPAWVVTLLCATITFYFGSRG